MTLIKPRPWTRIVLIASACLAAAGVSAQAQQREPPPSRPALQYSYSPIVRKAAPAVVNVYVRSRVQTMDSPFANDPIFRMFGQGFGVPARARAELARLGRDHQRRRRHRDQHARRQGRHRHADPRSARRQARVRRQDRRPGRQDRPRGPQDRQPRGLVPVPRVLQLRPDRGGRRGARHRQPLRRRPDRDERNHLRADADRDGSVGHAGVPADGRRDQPRQLGRRARRHAGQARRHQHDDLLADRRLRRHRFRHTLEPRAHRCRQRDRRPQDRAAVAWRADRYRHPRNGGEPRD